MKFTRKSLRVSAVLICVLTLLAAVSSFFGCGADADNENGNTEPQTVALADFKTADYNGEISVADSRQGLNSGYEKAEDGVRFISAAAWASSFAYTPKAPLKTEELASLIIKYKIPDYPQVNLTLNVYDETGAKRYFNLRTSDVVIKTEEENDFVSATIEKEYLVSGEDGLKSVCRLEFRRSHDSLKDVAVIIDGIYYVKDAVAFGRESGDKGFLIADFDSEQYLKYIKTESGSKTVVGIEDGSLSVFTGRKGFWEDAAEYSFKKGVPLSDFGFVTFETLAPFAALAGFNGENGEKLYISRSSRGVTVKERKDGRYEWTVDIEERLKDSTDNTFTKATVIKGMSFTAAAANAEAVFDEIYFRNR